MESILNFSEPLNVSLLDRIVDTFYGGFGAEVRNRRKEEDSVFVSISILILSK
jgi:hypothetical protein